MVASIWKSSRWLLTSVKIHVSSIFKWQKQFLSDPSNLSICHPFLLTNCTQQRKTHERDFQYIISMNENLKIFVLKHETGLANFFAFISKFVFWFFKLNVLTLPSYTSCNFVVLFVHQLPIFMKTVHNMFHFRVSKVSWSTAGDKIQVNPFVWYYKCLLWALYYPPKTSDP